MNDPATSLKTLFNLSQLVQSFSLNKKISLADKNLFIQFGILVNANQFKNMCSSEQLDKLKLQKILNKITSLTNLARSEVIIGRLEPLETIELEYYPTLLSALYQIGYFTEISVKLLSFIDMGRNVTLNEKQCNAILGLLIGASTHDLELTRFAAI